ncbi:MAG: hypothetical protein WDO70_05425 [Alphaproteobacteria bacterium]
MEEPVNSKSNIRAHCVGATALIVIAGYAITHQNPLRYNSYDPISVSGDSFSSGGTLQSIPSSRPNYDGCPPGTDSMETRILAREKRYADDFSTEARWWYSRAKDLADLGHANAPEIERACWNAAQAGGLEAIGIEPNAFSAYDRAGAIYGVKASFKKAESLVASNISARHEFRNIDRILNRAGGLTATGIDGLEFRKVLRASEAFEARDSFNTAKQLAATGKENSYEIRNTVEAALTASGWNYAFVPPEFVNNALAQAHIEPQEFQKVAFAGIGHQIKRLFTETSRGLSGKSRACDKEFMPFGFDCMENRTLAPEEKVEIMCVDIALIGGAKALVKLGISQTLWSKVTGDCKSAGAMNGAVSAMPLPRPQP